MLYTTIHIQCFGQFKALKSAYLSLQVLWKLGAACRIKSSTPAQVLFSIPGHAQAGDLRQLPNLAEQTSDLSILRFSRDLASSQSFNIPAYH